MAVVNQTDLTSSKRITSQKQQNLLYEGPLESAAKSNYMNIEVKGITVLAIGGDAVTTIEQAREEGRQISKKILEVSGGGITFELLLRGIKALRNIRVLIKEEETTKGQALSNLFSVTNLISKNIIICCSFPLYNIIC